MDGVTKARINLKEGTVELEGSEAFVTKYLDEFKLQVSVGKQAVEVSPVAKRTVRVKSADDSKAVTTAKKSVKKLKPEEFDIEGNAKKPSLKDFFEQKSPRAAAAEYIAVVGYYVTKYNGQEYFTEGNVEFAYRILGLGKPPLKMHQSFIDAKNKKFYVEESSVEGVGGAWELQRIGEQFVEHNLPHKTK